MIFFLSFHNKCSWTYIIWQLLPFIEGWVGYWGVCVHPLYRQLGMYFKWYKSKSRLVGIWNVSKFKSTFLVFLSNSDKILNLSGLFFEIQSRLWVDFFLKQKKKRFSIFFSWKGDMEEAALEFFFLENNFDFGEVWT